MPDLADELLQRVAMARLEDLRALIHALDLARDAAIARLMEPPPTRFLTPEDAAALLSLPERRLRSLARGKPWALRIGGSLRIDEAAFLRWGRERSQSAGNARGRARERSRDVHGVQESAVLRR
jgi:hypothetical protein